VHVTHDELATAPSVMHHDYVRIGQPPWLSQKIMGPEPIGHDTVAHGQVASWSRP
jgi:hypothetical protein